MKSFLLSNLFVLLLAEICGGFAPSASNNLQPSLTASIKRGQTVFMQNCLACHQSNGAGVPNLNPPLIKTKYVLGDKQQLITILLHGLTGEIQIEDDTFNGTMPPHNFLNDQQIADVLTYVRNSFGNKASLIKPSEVKAVRSKLKV